jgi:hypothetical protein
MEHRASDHRMTLRVSGEPKRVCPAARLWSGEVAPRPASRQPRPVPVALWLQDAFALVEPTGELGLPGELLAQQRAVPHREAEPS